MFKELKGQFSYNSKVKSLSLNSLRGFKERLTNFYRFLKGESIPYERVDKSTMQFFKNFFYPTQKKDLTSIIHDFNLVEIIFENHFFLWKKKKSLF